MKNITQKISSLLVIICLLSSLISCSLLQPKAPVNLDNIPAFSGEPYVVINNNKPFFEDSELTTESYEKYGDLDHLGRCTAAIACIGKDLMPTEDRDNISQVKPSGWQSVAYNGQYLYNRCHLIGFQLTGENANDKNLITGTRYLNIEGMLPFENLVDDYIEETENHVMYRVTPIYDGNNLVASGVLMEGYSVEDNGEICFNVYVYNNQPGIEINYADGTSRKADVTQAPTTDCKDNNEADTNVSTEYAVNTSSKKFHKTTCRYADSSNIEIRTATKEELIADGYSACKTCNP